MLLEVAVRVVLIQIVYLERFSTCAVTWKMVPFYLANIAAILISELFSCSASVNKSELPRQSELGLSKAG